MAETEKEKEKGRGKGKARTARLDAVAGGRRGSTRRIGKAGCASLLSLTLSVAGDGEKQRKGKEEDARAARWLSPPPAAAGQDGRGAAPCSHQSERERRVGADCARVTAGSTGGRFCSPDPRAGPSD